jgi:SM-20-related protein
LTELTYQANCWEEVADALAENDYCCINGYLNSHEVEALIAEITSLRKADTFKKAGIGADQNFTVQKEIRGDFIKWLSLESAAGPALKFLQGIELIQKQLSRLLFIPLKDFECH